MAMTLVVPPLTEIVTRDAVVVVVAAVLVRVIEVVAGLGAVVPALAVVHRVLIAGVLLGKESAATVTRKRIVSMNVNVARRVFQILKRNT